MSVLAFDFYSEDDPNGTLLGTLDDTDLLEMELRPALHELGSGLLVVSRHNTAATSALIRENNIVKVRIPSVDTDPIWAFILKEGEFVLIDSKEQGGEHLTFGGPGLIYLLGQARLYHSSQVSDQPFRGSVDRPGMWTWINESYGAILTRIIEEGRQAPFPDPATSGAPLENLTITFDRVNDSDGNPWPTFDPTSFVLDNSAAFSVILTVAPNGYTVGDQVVFTTLGGGAGLVVGQSYFVISTPSATAFTVSESLGGPIVGVSTSITGGTVESTNRTEFTTPIGSDMLTVAERLSVAGDLYLVMDPDLTLHAYQAFGRTLTGAFASDNVRFEKGVNILTQLVRNIAARDMVTHLLQQDSDGYYSTEISPDYVAGTRQHWGFFEAAQTNNDSQLNKIAQNVIAASLTSGQAHELEITPGFVPASGRYMPGPEGTDGHFWLGDHVTLHTGSGEHDFNAAEQIVVAIRIVLDEASDDSTDDTAARSLHIVPELNYQEVRGFTGVSPAALGQPGYCCGPSAPTQPTVVACTRLYTSDDGDPPNLTSDADWDDTGVYPPDQLYSTPQGTVNGGGNETARGSIRLRGLTFTLDAAMAATIAAGGATIRAQFRVRARSGIGISEASQDLISQMGVRVTQGDTAVIRGTAKALHSLASSAGSTKWRANSTYQNRSFPAAADTNVLTAVPGTVAGDKLVVEVGYHNFTPSPIPTGGGIWVRDAASETTLPEDELETANLNSWIEFCTPGGGGEDSTQPIGLPGSGSVGTNTNVYAPIDHVHEHGTLADDDVHLHDADQVSYDGTTSGLTATDVQEAIDQLATGAASGAVTDHGAMGTTEEFDAADSGDHEGVLDDDLTVTLTGATDGEAAWLTLALTDDGSGPYTITWPGSVAWPGGVAPTPPDAGEALVVSLLSYDGGTTWYGSYPGAGSAVGDLDDLGDVVITAPTEGDMLHFDGTEWVNAAPSAIGLVGAILMTDGITNPPEPLWTDDGTDYLYADF